MTRPNETFVERLKPMRTFIIFFFILYPTFLPVFWYSVLRQLFGYFYYVVTSSTRFETNGFEALEKWHKKLREWS